MGIAAGGEGEHFCREDGATGRGLMVGVLARRMMVLLVRRRKRRLYRTWRVCLTKMLTPLLNLDHQELKVFDGI